MITPADHRRRQTGAKLLGYAAMACVLVLIGVPLYWMVITSFKDRSDIYVQPANWWPHVFHAANYVEATSNVPFWTFVRNSIIITSVVSAVKFTLGVLSAYGLVFLRFPFKNVVFLTIIAALMVPNQITVISNYALIAQMGWRNTFQGIIVLLTRVVLPISGPTMVAFAMISIVDTWNEYLWPFLMSDDGSVAPLPVGLTLLQDNENPGSTNWGPVMAGTVLTMLPMLVIFLVLQRHMIKGLTSGAVKG
jgi:sn-glycerol 3-phosphate transport system permease protein